MCRILNLVFFRLFYLWQDTLLKYVTEEGLFSSLIWLSPALSALAASLSLGENFLDINGSQLLSVRHASSSKVPSWKFSFYYTVKVASYLLILLITFGIHIALIIKQRKLEKLRSDGIMVVTYNENGVTISSRSPNLQLSQLICKHHRTVVTPIASFVSFLFNILTLIVISFFFFTTDNPASYAQLIIIVVICQLFFVNTLIETILSPTLRSTLKSYLLCRRQAYHVANI